MPRGENSKRKQESRRRENSSHSDEPSSRAGKSLLRGRSKAIAHPRRYEATRFQWSGPRSRAASRNFPKWIVPIGLPWWTPERISQRDRSDSWIDLSLASDKFASPRAAARNPSIPVFNELERNLETQPSYLQVHQSFGILRFARLAGHRWLCQIPNSQPSDRSASGAFSTRTAIRVP